MITTQCCVLHRGGGQARSAAGTNWVEFFGRGAKRLEFAMLRDLFESD
jgi:hypothetical protein